MKFAAMKHIYACLIASTLLQLLTCALAVAEDPNAALQTVLSRDAVTALLATRDWESSDGTKLATGKLLSVEDGVLKVASDSNAATEIQLTALSKADQAVIAEVTATKRPVVYAPIGDSGEIRVRYDWPKVFLLKGGTNFSLGFLNISYREAGEHQSLTGGYIKVGGVATRIVVASSDTNVFDIEQDERPAGTGYTFQFKNPGTANIRIQIGDDGIILIPVDVVGLAVSAGDDLQSLIDEYGLPETKDTVFASWPESETEDGMFYNPSARQGTIAAQHWKFEKLTPCVVSIVNNKVHGCGLDDDFTLLATSSEVMKWYEGNYDGITRRKTVEPQEQPPKQPASPRFVSRLWKDRTGKFSVTAAYSGRIGNKVILKKEDGERLYVPLAKLSESDRAWIADGEK